MPLIFLIAEVSLVYWFVQAFGFLNFFLFYVVTMAIGILLVKQVGAKSLREFQTGQVTTANRSLISRGLLFLSGLLLIIPSMWSKLFGAVLILPPVRWIVSAVFTGFLLKKVFGADSFVHQFGRGGFKFYYQSKGQNPFQSGPFYDQNGNINDENTQEITGDVIDAQFRKVEEDPKLLK